MPYFVHLKAYYFARFAPALKRYCFWRFRFGGLFNDVLPWTEAIISKFLWFCFLSVVALIQVVAASAAKRDVCYFTFGDMELTESLYEIHKLLCDSNRTIGMYEFLCKLYFLLIFFPTQVLKCLKICHLNNFITLLLLFFSNPIWLFTCLIFIHLIWQTVT